MRKLISQVLAFLGFGAAIFAVIAVPWYIFGDLPNPLPQPLLAETWAFPSALRWMSGLVAYIAAGCIVTLVCMVSSRILLVGWTQFIAEEKAKAAKAKKEAIREAGTLMSVSVDSGGVLDSATSMIETTNGFYRVFGKVDVATKGETGILR